MSTTDVHKNPVAVIGEAGSSDLPEFARSFNIYRMMAAHRDLLTAWGPLRKHVVADSRLTAWDKELIILRTAFRRAAPYEWEHHLVRGAASGLCAERMLRARSAGRFGGDEGADELLFAIVDDLILDGKVEQMRLVALQTRFDMEEVLDIFATIGMYVTLGFIANTFAIPLEDDFEPFA
jgi:alkylhydroperoxidase family enzyme